MTCDHTAELQALTARVAALDATTARLTARLDATGDVERYYDLPSAAGLLGVTVHSVRLLLAQHRALLALPVYRWDQRHRRYRMLPATDVRMLQTLRIRRRNRIRENNHAA